MALDGLLEFRITTFRYEKRQLPRGRIIFLYMIYIQVAHTIPSVVSYLKPLGEGCRRCQVGAVYSDRHAETPRHRL